MDETDPGRRAVRRFYEAEARYMSADAADFTPVAATLHQDCLLCEPASLPYGGEWRGHEGFERWMRLFKATWSSMEVRGSELFGEGDTLFSRSHVHAQARATGKPADWPLLQIFIIRQGLVHELRPFHWDTAAILPALGTRPRERSGEDRGRGKRGRRAGAGDPGPGSRFVRN